LSGNPSNDCSRFDALPEKVRREMTLFTGHAPLISGVEAANTAKTITFLRNPVSRVKSFCQHVSEGKSPYLIAQFPPERFDLDKFLESGNDELSNLQTKMLINDNNCTSSLLINSMSAQQARDMALENLYHKIAHFGLQEYFDESLMIFYSALGWRIPVYYTRNTKANRKALRFEQRHLDRISELNRIDLEVYEVARKHLVGIIEGAEFDLEKLRRFRTFNNPVVRSVIRVMEFIQPS